MKTNYREKGSESSLL